MLIRDTQECASSLIHIFSVQIPIVNISHISYLPQLSVMVMAEDQEQFCLFDHLSPGPLVSDHTSATAVLRCSAAGNWTSCSCEYLIILPDRDGARQAGCKPQVSNLQDPTQLLRDFRSTNLVCTINCRKEEMMIIEIVQ